MMKPGLVVQDFGGVHNANPEGSRARLIKGASWKKQRIVVVIPAGEMIPAKVALSHWNLIFPPNNGVVRILAQGMEVGDAYSSAIEGILAHPDLSQWEYLLTLEHDNLPPQDGVLKLLERMEAHPEYAAISGLYWCKGPGGCAHVWGDINDPVVNYRPQTPIPGELMECYGLSMGFAIYRMKMFRDERLKRPLFRTLAGKSGVGTQDLSFWGEARKYGYRCAVDVDCQVGHFSVEEDMVW